MKPLEKLFKKGQYLCVKVIQLETKAITLSVNPNDINGDKYHGQLHKGLVICGAVSDIEDHGFAIDVGIKNVRAFLPIEKTKTKFSIGSLVYGCIDELSCTATTSTIILKTNKLNEIGMVELNEDQNPVLDLIVPGTIVPFTLTKVLKNGLEGTIYDTFVSYVNENYLTEPLHRPNDYTIGLQFEARLLYVTPLTKHAALTMNFGKVKFTGDDGILPVGNIIEEAVSMGQSSGSILLKLNRTAKGIIKMKSIKSKYKSNYDSRTALLQYAKSTKHKVRIMDYDPLERVYICTDNEYALEQTYFSINDIAVGDVVNAQITMVLKDKGYAVKIGRIRGYIHNIDCAAGNLAVKATIKARVLFVDHGDNTVQLTNRTEFLKSKNILGNINQVELDKIFTGIIVKETPTMYLVRFFNKIRGVVNKDNIGLPELSVSSLREGVILDFKITDLRNGKIFLKAARDIDSCDHLGTVVSAKLECLYPTGAQIKIKKLNLTGNIPVNYFTDFIPMAEAVFNAMKEGQKLKVVNLMNQIYSLRDTEYYQQSPPLTFQEVQVGDVLKCFVRSFEKGIVEIICPLKDYRQSLKLHINKILSTSLSNPKDFELKPDTVIYVRVTDKLSTAKTLGVSAKLEDVWNGNSDSSVDLMQKYFHDMDLVRSSAEEKGKPIAIYRVGQKVKGTIVEKLDELEILVLTLDNGISSLCRNVQVKKYNVGDTVEGKIVWIDYVRQVVDLVINPQAMAHIKEDQIVDDDLLKEKTRCKGHVILVRDDLILVSIGGKGPLVHIAPRFHMNDFQPTLINSFACYGKANVHLLKVVEGRLVGMFEENYKQCQSFMQVYEQKHAVINKKRAESKRKRVEEIQDDDNTADEEEPGSILRLKPSNDDDLEPPKKKKKKHLKGLTKGKVNPNSVKLNVKNKQKKKFTVKKNGTENTGNIENMFKNQLDGAMDFNTKNKKKQKNNIIEQKKKNYVSLQVAKEKEKTKKAKSFQKEIDLVSVETKFQVEKLNNILSNQQSVMQNSFGRQKKRKLDSIPDTVDSKLTVKKMKNCFSNEKKIESQKMTQEIEIKNVKNKKLSIIKIDRPSQKDSTSNDHPKPTHAVPGAEGFWSNKPLQEIDISQENDDDDALTGTDPTSKSKFGKNSEPKSVRDFDRLLLHSPDDSKLWIKYMKFHMKAFEIEKAKGVGQRALKIINYRNENDKLNIWMELLKIEIQHGTSESFNTLFREAILRNQPLNIYSKTFGLLIESEKIPQINGLLGTMMKKYKPHAEMWKITAETYYQINVPEKAKELLERAYKSLPKDERM